MNESDPVDIGLSHVALPVADVDVSIAFYERFAGMSVVHRRVDDDVAVAWISDHTRPFIVVLLGTTERDAVATLGGWAHLGVGCASRDEVDRRLADAAAAGFRVLPAVDAGPPVGYYGIIKDPDGHNLEVAYGQHVEAVVVGT
ncbi:MAG: VOC family protein [Microthrixaceae bacterium]